MMSQSATEKPSFRILSFVNDKEDAESRLKLKEATAKIERAIAMGQATKELLDRQIDEEEPLDAANDTRPLYQRLLDQKMQKQELIEESQRLSNYVAKLDEEEVDFLKQVDQQKLQEEISRKQEEMEAIDNYKRVMSARRNEEEEKLQKILTWGSSLTTNNITSKQDSQSKGSRREKLSNLIRVVPRSAAKAATPVIVAAKSSNNDTFKDATKVPDDDQNQPQSSKQYHGISRLCSNYSDDDDDDDDDDDEDDDEDDQDDQVEDNKDDAKDKHVHGEPEDAGRETRSSRRAANKSDQNQSEATKPTSKIEPINPPSENSKILKRKKQNSDSEDDPDESDPKRECLSASQSSYQTKGVLRCIGILPAMSNMIFNFSDSSDDSSDSSNEDFDPAPLLTRVGRKAKQEHHEG